MVTESRYSARGVSASKEDVHEAIKNVDKGIFPSAFCKIIPEKNNFFDNYRLSISFSRKKKINF